MHPIQQNIRDLKERVKLAAQRVKRDPEEIQILAVVKTVELPKIFEAIESGITLIGENKIQEALTRNKEIRNKNRNIKMHMIGHLQTNKVKQAIDMFDVIESVDSYHLAEAISAKTSNQKEIFIEVNTSSEASKYGIALHELHELVDQISQLKNIKITGLMTVGPLSQDEKEVRKCFRKLREARDELCLKGFMDIRHLSMGMSHDFEVAIEEGSDIIRIGSSIFGKRLI